MRHRLRWLKSSIFVKYIDYHNGSSTSRPLLLSLLLSLSLSLSWSSSLLLLLKSRIDHWIPLHKRPAVLKKSMLLCLMAWGSSNVASNPRSNMIIPWPPQLVARKRIMLLLSKGTPKVYHSFYWSKINLLLKFQNSNRYFDVHYCNSTYYSTIVFCIHIFQTLCDGWIYSYQVLNHIKHIVWICMPSLVHYVTKRLWEASFRCGTYFWNVFFERGRGDPILDEALP